MQEPRVISAAAPSSPAKPPQRSERFRSLKVTTVSHSSGTARGNRDRSNAGVEDPGMSLEQGAGQDVSEQSLPQTTSPNRVSPRVTTISANGTSQDATLLVLAPVLASSSGIKHGNRKSRESAPDLGNPSPPPRSVPNRPVRSSLDIAASHPSVPVSRPEDDTGRWSVAATRPTPSGRESGHTSGDDAGDAGSARAQSSTDRLRTEWRARQRGRRLVAHAPAKATDSSMSMSAWTARLIDWPARRSAPQTMYQPSGSWKDPQRTKNPHRGRKLLELAQRLVEERTPSVGTRALLEEVGLPPGCVWMARVGQVQCVCAHVNALLDHDQIRRVGGRQHRVQIWT